MYSRYATHAGLVRQNNEDSIKTDDALGIYLLADGIGGHNAGEVASALAVDTVYSILRANITHTAADDYFELMVHALHAAHWEIYTKAQADPSMARMGTTLVVAVVQNNRAYIVNAGDSRCYLLQREYYSQPDPLLGQGYHRFTRLTNDHTVGEQLLANGTPLGDIPQKQFHALTRSLGCGNPPYPDFSVIEISHNDMLLICSDGLTDMLTDAEIETLLADNTVSLDVVAATLINAANAKGGRDNISVVLVSQQA
ncbi:protein phosphatase [Trichlorobacter thiogenes]|uniref:Protein phosphatase n=1 Tax=Trichlorobacter thiogenes TaxID=115783 RepID=A0A1T4NXV4_9BACT|nr:protein phosphatase 2C domain-containing protein [Trichlorobacter thiogenes]SJZ84104.1 protein phosphatase [Trichlorobacter thiogenes]